MLLAGGKTLQCGCEVYVQSNYNSLFVLNVKLVLMKIMADDNDFELLKFVFW